MRLSILPLALLAALLAACSAEPASYLIAGSEVALTVERTKPYFWSDSWDLSLVARRNPECQRRYPLKRTTGNSVRLEVYSPETGVYILRQGKRWYVTELAKCGFDTFKEAPPEPGELLGVFQEKAGVFKFVEATEKGGKSTEAE
jgi:hypothetical protein